MEEDDSCVVAAATILIGCNSLLKSKRRKKSCWIKEWLKKRKNQGAYNALISDT